MLKSDLDKDTAVLVMRPESPLSKDDFTELAKLVDPQIEAKGDLSGIIIDAAHFPGWDSFGALVKHIRFIHDHQKHVKKIAIVTDSHIGEFAQHVGSHFVAAQVRGFSAGEMQQARDWIAQD